MHIYKTVLQETRHYVQIYHSMEKAIKIEEGKIYIPIENISRGIDEPSNPLLTRAIGYCTIAGEMF